MGDYEKQQARLLRIWEEIQAEEDDAVDAVEELAYEEDVTQTRDTDSETEQEMDQDESDSDTSSDNSKLRQKSYFTGKDGKSKWNKICGSKNVRTRTENLILILPGVKGNARNMRSHTECWELIISKEIVQIITENTNRYIESVADKYKRDRSTRSTDVIEIRALLGLLYLAGVLKSGRINSKELWDRNGIGAQRFWLTMSHQRFLFLLRCLRFDDLTTREERRSIDKLAPIRDVFNLIVANCKSAYTPGEFTTIDEKLEAFRGRCGFKQYIPSKPNKYGIKIFAVADSRTSYALNLEVYVGQQPEGPYSMKNDPESIVLRMVSSFSGTNRNVTCDNWFTSYNLVKVLLNEHRLTYVGTMKKNKREIPPEFVNTRARSVYSSVFGFQKDFTIVSYVPKRYKNVILISSLHHDHVIDAETGDKKKPDIITFYNHTKGGVDNLDKLCATYDVARNTRRWPMVIFYALLNVAGINSQIIYVANNPDIKSIERRQFLRKLSFDLTEEHLKRRSMELNVPIPVRERRQEVAGTSQPTNRDAFITLGKRKRCYLCHADNKSKYYCFKCQKFVCLQHAVILCPDCKKG